MENVWLAVPGLSGGEGNFEVWAQEGNRGKQC
jgi:hypothetical protein